MKEIIMTAAQIAEAVNGKVKGNGEQTVKSVNSLKLAANDEVSFLSNVKYVNQLTASKAGIVLISDQWDYEPAENQTFILAQEFCEFVFQLDVKVECTVQEAGTGATGAIFAGGFDGCFHDSRFVSEAHI